MNINFQETFVPFSMRSFSFNDCKDLVSYYGKRLNISLELVEKNWRMESLNSNVKFVCLSGEIRYSFVSLEEVQKFVATLENM